MYISYFQYNSDLPQQQCEDLNRLYQTETLVLFCRSEIAHSYSSGSFATEGARKWLENVDVGHDTPQNVAIQMEAFCISGVSKRLQKSQGGMYHIPISSTSIYATMVGNARFLQRKIRSECRKLIQDGLGTVFLCPMLLEYILTCCFRGYSQNQESSPQ